MRNFTSRLLNGNRHREITEQRARALCAPWQPHVEKPEATLPELTSQQRATLDTLALSHDDIGPCQLKPNGWLEVRATTYDAGSRCVNFIDVSPDGLTYDTGEESAA